MKNFLVYPKLFFILILFSLLLVFFDNLGLLFFPKLIGQTITLPIQYGFYQIGRSTVGQFQFLIDARFAAMQNKALRIQLSQVISDNAVLSKKLQEEEALISQENKLSPETFNLLPAQVAGLGRSLIIDKGSQDGIRIGQAVVYQDNYIGQVKEVNPKSAQVLLPFDPDSKVAAFSQNKNGRAKGILLGQFGSELLMDKVLHQEPISVGDLVYSEGTEGTLPRGLILGKVEKVLDNQNQVFKQALVRPVFDFNDLDIVFVMKGN